MTAAPYPKPMRRYLKGVKFQIGGWREELLYLSRNLSEPKPKHWNNNFLLKPVSSRASSFADIYLQITLDIIVSLSFCKWPTRERFRRAIFFQALASAAQSFRARSAISVVRMPLLDLTATMYVRCSTVQTHTRTDNTPREGTVF